MNQVLLTNKVKLIDINQLLETIKCSRTSAWRYTRSEVNPLPHIKLRGRLYFDYYEVLKW